MSTNFYFRDSEAIASGNPWVVEGFHIGKSSVGWAFQLHVFEVCREGRVVLSIQSLDDWYLFIEKCQMESARYQIFDEYGVKYSLEDLLRVIQNRIMLNGAAVRHSDIDGLHCVGRGDGTWDLVKGEFS